MVLVEGSRLPINWAASANQNITINVLCGGKKILKSGRHVGLWSWSAATEWNLWTPNITLRVSNSIWELMTRDISCDQMRQFAFIWMINGTQVIVHSTSPHSTTWQSDPKLVKRRAGLGVQHRTLCLGALSPRQSTSSKQKAEAESWEELLPCFSRERVSKDFFFFNRF